MGHLNKAETFQLSAGTVKVVGEFSEKLKNNKRLAALGTTPLALILSACGGGSSTTTTSTASTNLLTLTKSADTYSASAVTGFTVADTSTAKFDVADATSNAYEIKLDATGTGVLEFDFADAGDTVTLAAGSKTSGFTTLKVTDGTLDATDADLTGITRVEVASGIKISLAQIKEIPTLIANSATSEITVELASESEATELVALISAGTVKVFADANPIKLVAASTATIATETLTTKLAETTASVKPTTEAPADTASTDTTTDTGTDDTTTDTGTATGGGGGSAGADFGVIKSGAGTYIVGTTNGDVTVSKSGDLATFTPSTGVAVTKVAADVTGLRVDDITVTSSAAIASGKTITGNGNLTVTALDATADADFSLITATGTLTANVADDVTFTGDLGTFAVTVDTGKTLTTTAAKATGLAMTGAGGVSITALDADADADLSSITASGTLTANVADDVTFTGDLGTFGVTVDSGKTLTTTSDKVTGLTITGGSVTISDDITANINITNIASTVDLSQADVAISASKTLTLTAAQAATETFSGAGTLAVTASTSDDSITATTTTLSVDTGAGDDTLIVGDAGKITAADAINMGTGSSDAIHIMADDDTTTGAVFDAAGHVGAETIKVLVSTTAATENAKVVLDYAAAYDQDITIDASLLTNASADFVLAVDTAANVDGDLTVKGSAGANTLASGDGADTFVMGDITTFTAADAVNGGAGTDEIRLTADDSSTGAVVDDLGRAGIEKITVLASSTATENAKITLNYANSVTDAMEIDASALTNASAVFTLAIGGTVTNVAEALTVTGGAGNDIIATSDGADVITGGNGADTITGDAGADTVIVDADDSVSVSDSTAGDATGSDHFNDWASGDLIQITGELADGFSAATDVLVGLGTENTDTSVVADAADFLTTTYLVARDGDVTNGFDTAMIVTSDGSAAAFADAAAAQAATSFNVTLAAGATVVLGAKNDTVVGSSTADVITGGAGVDTLNGGAGDDTFIVGTSHDGTAESYTGGDGTGDKLDVNAAADFSNDTLATIEILDLDAAGTAVAITMNDAQVDMLSTITSAASAIGTGDKITLGDVMTSDMLDGTVIGGSNDDEIIFILKDVASNALTLVDATMAASDKLYIDGSNLTGTNAFTFDGSAEDDAAVLTITGGAAADTITGGDGADVINGGAGADQLRGDAGADTFHIVDGDSGAWNIDSGNAKLASTTNFDIILDAAAGDVINLTAAVQSQADYGTFTTATAGANLTATTTTDTIAQFIGTYDASANTFLSDTSGDDIMLAFKGTDAGDTTVDEAIIIVGQTDVYANSELVAGVLTIA
jgi:hypothetical protein